MSPIIILAGIFALVLAEALTLLIFRGVASANERRVQGTFNRRIR
jgi:hypothetical protein